MIHTAPLPWIWGFYMEPEKHRRKLLHVTLHKFAQIFNQATDWPHLILVRLIFNPAALRARTGMKPAANMEQQMFMSFPPCVPYVSASHSSAFPVPLSQIRHCSIVKWHLYCLYPEAEVDRGKFRNVPFPYAPGPTQPPRMPNIQQMSMI